MITNNEGSAFLIAFMTRTRTTILDARDVAISILTPMSPQGRLAALAVFGAAVIYTVLFSEIAPVHDATHHLRHSILSIPCH